MQDVTEVELNLGADPGDAEIPGSKVDVQSVTWFVIIIIIERFLIHRLGKVVPILTDGIGVISSNNGIGSAGSRLQATVDRDGAG